MKLPRDISASELIRRLAIFGYVVARQTGSHIRLTTQLNGQHHVTVPNHNPLRAGTLASIVSDVAIHHGQPRADVIDALFGR